MPRLIKALVAVSIALLVVTANPNLASARPDSGARPAAAPTVHRAIESYTTAAAAWTCSEGYVCFWDAANGTGHRCSWNVADPDWTAGLYVCSWSSTRNVKSVYNHGTDSSLSGVAFYTSRNYVNRIGCTRQGQLGNLAGTYKVYSSRWITGSCG